MVSLIILALASDIKAYKIKNVIIYPFVLIGIITNIFYKGLDGLKLSFLGLIVPVLLLFILYVLRMLGAGDIKLFSAIGAIMGLEFVIYSIVYSFFSGGIIAIIILCVRKNGKQRFIHLCRYLKSCFLTFSLQPYTDFDDKSDGAKFRFAYAIFLGTIVNLILFSWQP